jgi:hypothetical protein
VKITRKPKKRNYFIVNNNRVYSPSSMSFRFRGNQQAGNRDNGSHWNRTDYRSRRDDGGYQGRDNGVYRNRSDNDDRGRTAFISRNDNRSKFHQPNVNKSAPLRPEVPIVQRDKSHVGQQVPTALTLEPDLQSILQQISMALTSLAGRVETIEKNKGSDSYAAVASRPIKTTAPAGPLITKNSNNNDFASVSKALYKIVQVGHHAANWDRLPKSIEERLHRLIADINPPMSDPKFRTAMSDITQSYGEEIRRLVSEHLESKKRDLEYAAGELDRTDIRQAKDVANKYLTARLGKRLVPQRRTDLLEAAASKVGLHFQPPPVVARSSVEAPSTWTMIGNRTPPKMDTPLVGNSARKRKLDSVESTPTNISNRFQTLIDEVVADTDLEPADSPNVIESSDQPRVLMKQPRKRATVYADVISEHGVHVFAGEKASWTITPETEQTCVIVVGDSNLRSVRLIPNYWQINSLPGAKIGTLKTGLSKLTGPAKQFTIVIQAGINHRASFSVNEEHEIRDMLFEARRNPSVDEIFFNGVSIPPGMNVDDAARLDALNRFMEEEVGSAHYIAPLDQADVTVMRNDRYDIHYDQATVDRISHRLFCSIIGPDF